MNRKHPLLAALLLCFASTCQASIDDEVVFEVRTGQDIPWMLKYVDKVENRFRNGLYDNIDPYRRDSVIVALGLVKDQLAGERGGRQPSDELDMLMGRFIGLVLEAEEGGIVCRRERRTGSQRFERVCYTKRRMAELDDQAKRNRHRVEGKTLTDDEAGRRKAHADHWWRTRGGVD